MRAILDYLEIGGLTAVLLTIFVEWTPIKLNPIQWLGARFYKAYTDRLDVLDKKLDEHIVQSYRSTILVTQKALLHGDRFTQEQYKVALKAIDNYTKYIEENH